MIVPGRRFGNYLSTMCGLIRRYGAREPTVMVALLRLLENIVVVAPDRPDRLAAVEEQANLILADAERETSQAADVAQVREAFDNVRQALEQAAAQPTSLGRATS